MMMRFFWKGFLLEKGQSSSFSNIIKMDWSGIEILVFDLDDTLCPERQFVESGFQAVSSYLIKCGIVRRDLFPEMWQQFCDGIRGAVFNNVLSAEGVVPEDDLIKKIVEVYRSHNPTISLYPEARQILNHFHGKKKLGLLSDGYLTTQKNKVSALGIEPFFDIIVFTDTMGRKFWKPDPAGYKKIMDFFGLSGEACIYIGDNPQKDFFGARILGWKTVQVKREDGIYKNDINTGDDYRADIIVDDLSRLVTIVS